MSQPSETPCILAMLAGPRPPPRRTYVIERTYGVGDPIFHGASQPVAYCAIWQDHTGVAPIMPRIAVGGMTVTEVEERMQRLWPGCECARTPVVRRQIDERLAEEKRTGPSRVVLAVIGIPPVCTPIVRREGGMDIESLATILDATTRCYRTGPSVSEHERGGVRVTEIFAMPPCAEMPADEEPVDVHVMVVGVNRTRAEESRLRLLGILAARDIHALLAAGPSYIDMGAVLGSQELALRLFALGAVLGLWEIITPLGFGFEGAEADEMAGRGFVLITGFMPGAG